MTSIQWHPAAHVEHAHHADRHTSSRISSNTIRFGILFALVGAIIGYGVGAFFL